MSIRSRRLIPDDLPVRYFCYFGRLLQVFPRPLFPFLVFSFFLLVIYKIWPVFFLLLFRPPIYMTVLLVSSFLLEREEIVLHPCFPCIDQTKKSLNNLHSLFFLIHHFFCEIIPLHVLLLLYINRHGIGKQITSVVFLKQTFKIQHCFPAGGIAVSKEREIGMIIQDQNRGNFLEINLILNASAHHHHVRHCCPEIMNTCNLRLPDDHDEKNRKEGCMLQNWLLSLVQLGILNICPTIHLQHPDLLLSFHEHNASLQEMLIKDPSWRTLAFCLAGSHWSCHFNNKKGLAQETLCSGDTAPVKCLHQTSKWPLCWTSSQPHIPRWICVWVQLILPCDMSVTAHMVGRSVSRCGSRTALLGLLALNS
ncbi:hypothetical protein VP01_320g4 [Puccinia sorghi]|uniref:Uncharacterized protein n=1 Tax=Puccinia sorghi TaxID=27349 RepID=A0A0L6V090_9BASI|nr:hypothetical protein VP01_320g4 [Puccinia sorghi]